MWPLHFARDLCSEKNLKNGLESDGRGSEKASSEQVEIAVHLKISVLCIYKKKKVIKGAV